MKHAQATGAETFAPFQQALTQGWEKALDHGDFRGLGVGQLLAPALAVHLDRFPALLHHLLQHLGDEHVVRGRIGGPAQLDVAILQRRLDQADRVALRRVAGLHGADQRRLYVIANHGSSGIRTGNRQHKEPARLLID